MKLKYPDTATFVKVTSDGYGNTKSSQQQVDIPVIFVQNTQKSRFNHQDAVEADALCWPDFQHAYIQENYNRLEGMYILQPLYGAGDAISWYQIIDVTINRDHLLNNQIDNIELRLKKCQPIPGVS